MVVSTMDVYLPPSASRTRARVGITICNDKADGLVMEGSVVLVWSFGKNENVATEVTIKAISCAQPVTLARERQTGTRVSAKDTVRSYDAPMS